MVNVFVVDLEYLQFVDLDNPEQKRLVDATIDADLGQLTKQSLYVRKNTLVLGTILWEHSVDKKIIKNAEKYGSSEDVELMSKFISKKPKKIHVKIFAGV